MSEIPEIQVLEKEHYFTQALVRLPGALPLPALGPSSLRLRTEVFSLTSNNFTYAKLGSLLGWWDAHPLPASAPAPYNDAAKYGRTNCWGYARVLESTFAGVAAGSYVWGYLPVGTLPLDLTVEPGPLPDMVLVTDSWRQRLMPIYNKYRIYPESKGLEIQRKDDGIAFDALVGVMHLTAYLINQFVFPADPREALLPGGADQPWTTEQADLRDAVVVNFAPGSKVGLAFADLLKHERADSSRPRAVLGAASEYSRAFVEGTGLYDEVAATDADPAATLARHLPEKAPKAVLVDFGGRAGAASRWAQALRPVLEARGGSLVYLGVGSEIEERGLPEVLAGMQAGAGTGVVSVNADDMRTRAVAKLGGEGAFREGLDRSGAAQKARGFRGFKPRWGEGMEAAIKGWDELARGGVGPHEGLVFKV